jgi:hypothetical protein
MQKGQLMPNPRSERTYALVGVYVNSPISSIVLYIASVKSPQQSSMSNPQVF